MIPFKISPLFYFKFTKKRVINIYTYIPIFLRKRPFENRKTDSVGMEELERARFQAKSIHLTLYVRHYFLAVIYGGVFVCDTKCWLHRPILVEYFVTEQKAVAALPMSPWGCSRGRRLAAGTAPFQGAAPEARVQPLRPIYSRGPYIGTRQMNLPLVRSSLAAPPASSLLPLQLEMITQKPLFR